MGCALKMSVVVVLVLSTIGLSAQNNIHWSSGLPSRSLLTEAADPSLPKNSTAGDPDPASLFRNYELQSTNLKNAKKELDCINKKLVNRLFTDRFEFILKPDFGNTIPDLFGNPSISTNQFTLKAGLVSLSYKLPFKEAFGDKKSGLFRYFLNYWEFGAVGGAGPKASTFAIGQPITVLQNALEGTAEVYLQFKVSSKDLRQAHEKARQDQIEAYQKAKDAAHDQLLRAITERLKPAGGGDHLIHPLAGLERTPNREGN